LLSIVLGLAACRPQPPSIVLISIDTLRSDRLPVYGYAQGVTPAIDDLRRDAILFENAFSPVPLTLPAHLSVFTGLLPPEHGVRDNGGFVLPSHTETLASRLRGAGYETAAFVSAGVLEPGTGIERGFDLFDSPGSAGGHGDGAYAERPGAATVAAATRWLAARAKAPAKPFLLFVHLYEPHAPYRPSALVAERFREAPYDGEVATADAAVGRLLEALRAAGQYDPAAVFLFSDHGEGFGEHGESGHGVTLYREAIQIPLLLKLPRQARAGATIETPVELTDLAPTALALAGRSTPTPSARPAEGLDLTTLDDDRAVERVLYAETYYPRLHYGWSELTSAIGEGWHLIAGPTAQESDELFDLDADPGERSSRLAAERRVVAKLRARLEALRRPLPDRVSSDAAMTPDPEAARRLMALGYLAGGSAPSGELPDPRTRRAALAGLAEARGHMGAGRYREATAILQPLAEADPRGIDLWLALAFSQERWDRPEATLRSFEKALELSGGSPAYTLYVARQLLRMNRLDEVSLHVGKLLQITPDQRDAHELASIVALLQGRLDDAWSAALRAGRVTPSFRHDLVAALVRSGRAADAERAARQLQPLELGTGA
jgi:arylsulfatase A-like enzyme